MLQEEDAFRAGFLVLPQQEGLDDQRDLCTSHGGLGQRVSGGGDSCDNAVGQL